MHLFSRTINIAVLMLMYISALGQNLVQNGSAEEYDTVSQAPLNWSSSAAWQCLPAGPSFCDSVVHGARFFFASGASIDTLWQDVDVSSYSSSIDAGGQFFTFSGYVQSFPQGAGASDQTRFLVTCLNNAKTSVLHTFDSDTISSISHWQHVTDAFAVPASTRYIRVMLIATRRAGFANDGYFDAISLGPGYLTSASSQHVSDTHIFPNPAKDVLYIKGAAGEGVTIADIAGHEVYSGILSSGYEGINIEHLQRGMYFVTLHNEEGPVVIKMVKDQ